PSRAVSHLSLTTLFRSLDVGGARRSGDERDGVAGDAQAGERVAQRLTDATHGQDSHVDRRDEREQPAPLARGLQYQRTGVGDPPDRKSTRLNSSHRTIS